MSAKKIPILASPNVLRLSRELGIDIKLVHPSSKSGRISIDDVKKYVNELLTKKVSVANDNFQKFDEDSSDFNLYHTYHLDLIDELYSQWSEDPNAVEAWKYYFEGYQTGKSENKIIVNQSVA